MKNDIKVTILEVENELVKDNFIKGQVISLHEANERFQEIEAHPQWIIEDSKRLGINHPYTKVGFKVELHDGKSINVRYSFGTHECKSLIDCIEGAVGYGQYLTGNEKEFHKDFKNEAFLIKAAENFKKYLSSLSTEALRNIYDKFHEIDREGVVEMDVADKILVIDVEEEKGKYKFDINDSRYVEYVDEVLKDTIKELIEHKPIEAMKILKDCITEELEDQCAVKIGKVEELASKYFKEDEVLSLIGANEKFKKADIEIASIINSSEDINCPVVGFFIETNRIGHIGTAYSIGSMQRKDLIDLVQRSEYEENSNLLDEFNCEALLVDAYENCKNISMDYLKNEYVLGEANSYYANSIIDKNGKLMYGDKLNEFGELEAFDLIDKSNSVLSYDLPKEITGLSKDYFVDFSRRYKMDSQNVASRIVQIDTNNSKSISATRKILDASNFIKDANLKPSLEKKQAFNSEMDLSF